MQKICAEVDTRLSGVLVKSSTNSDAGPANHNALTVRDGMCDWAFTQRQQRLPPLLALDQHYNDK